MAKDYVEMLCKLYVSGSKDVAEWKWAEKIGMKSYQLVVNNFANPIFTPLYNKIWHWIDKDLIVDPDDKSQLYNRIYVGIVDWLIKMVVFLKGGYNFITKRKVTVTVWYYMEPDPGAGKNHYIIKDMISVKDFGA